MNKLSLKDSSSYYPDNAYTIGYSGQPAEIMQAIDELNRQIDNGEVSVISLNRYMPRPKEDAHPISYNILSYTTLHNHKVVDECVFLASHYIGMFTHSNVNITIRPRFGEHIFKYILSFATNIYIPKSDDGVSDSRNDDSRTPDWLLAHLWKGMLTKALTEGQIPKEYQRITRNQKYFSGRLDISKQIRFNLTDASKFYCTYKKLSLNNSINRTIRCAYGILNNRGYSGIIGDLDAYDKRLQSMGVTNQVELNEIDNVKYTRMTFPYIPVMRLSKTIIKHFNTTKEDVSNKMGASYFLDMAELWEMYLLKLLQRGLKRFRFSVYSPNTYHGECLLEGMREIRPDILIEKDGRIVAIIDAKYKRYESFGKTASQGVQREDLYQMATYLYHYATNGHGIIGIFTSPTKCSEKDIHPLTHNKSHLLGLINLDIDSCQNVEQIHEKEKEYIENIRSAIPDS